MSSTHSWSNVAGVLLTHELVDRRLLVVGQAGSAVIAATGSGRQDDDGDQSKSRFLHVSPSRVGPPHTSSHSRLRARSAPPVLTEVLGSTVDVDGELVLVGDLDVEHPRALVGIGGGAREARPDVL